MLKRSRKNWKEKARVLKRKKEKIRKMFKKQERKEREGGRKKEKGKRKTLVIDQEGKKCRGKKAFKKHTERWKKIVVD